MKYVYTAVLSLTEDGREYYAAVPDLPGCVTTGETPADAIDEITDAAAGWLVVAEDEELPIAEATPQRDLPHNDNDILTLIRVDTVAYRDATDSRAVRKNVTIPQWMATLADKRGLNCSQVLQEGIRQHLGI